MANHKFDIRTTTEFDIPQILTFIKAIAEYEKLSDKVVATEETLRKSIFIDKHAEVLFAELDGIPIGFALFFHNFSTFTGHAGLYLEDLFIYKQYRGKGYGKQMFIKLAQIAVERHCPRFEWICLDWNKPSIDFYLSLKAVPLSEWTVYRLEGEKIRQLAQLTNQ